MTPEDRAQIQGLATRLGITYEQALERVCEHLVRAGDNAVMEGADVPPDLSAFASTPNIAMADDSSALPSGSGRQDWERLTPQEAVQAIMDRKG